MVAARLAIWAVAAASVFTGVLARPAVEERNLARQVTVTHVYEPVVKVYVVLDQYGNTVSRIQSTIYPGATPAPRKAGKGRKKGFVTKSLDEPEATPAPVPAPEEAPKPKASKGGSNGGSKGGKKGGNSSVKSTSNGKLGKGIVYSPYHDNGNCKDKETTRSEIKEVISSGEGYNWIRIYGTDCDQVPNVMGAAYENGVTVMLGIYDLKSDSGFQTELDNLISGVTAANKEAGKDANDWSGVAFVSIGNEVVFNHNGEAETWVSKVLQYADTARSALREAGYTGDVGNTDVWYLFKEYPQLCGKDKLVMINMHPFFDQNCDVASSGNFLKEKLAEVQDACGSDHKVVIAETGWPNSGNQLNKAVPGKSQQAQFLQLAAANLDDYCLLSAFDEGWKSENSSAEVEKHWGILGKSPSS